MNTALSASNSAGDLQDSQVHAELVAVLFARARISVFSTAAVSLSAFAFAWPSASLSWMLLWLVMLVLLSVGRLVLIARYYKVAPPPTEAGRWGRYFTISAAVAGSFWGASGLLIFVCLPFDPALTVMVATVYAGFTAGAVPALGGYPRACRAFIFPLQLVTIGFMLGGETLHYTLAVLAVFFMLLNLMYARNAYSIMLDAVTLRFQNARLVDSLTEKHQVAEKAREAAEHANAAKSKFLAAASHDLRQPLHALALFVTVLNARIRRPDIGTRFPDLRRMVDNINLSLQGLETLFNALLDISRLDAGVIQPQVCSFRLDELFERLYNDYAPQARQKHLVFERPPANGYVLRSDAQLLERILRNYLSNAVHYTEQGYIALRASAMEGAICIEVADSGKGIPREKQQEIFHEFHQLENPERDRTKGLGLGLAIVDRLARLLQHPISVDSEPGRGSVFRVSVPVGDSVEVHPKEEFEAPYVDLSGLLVLVVEDEGSVRAGMEALLDQWECDAMLAGSEDEAVEQLRQSDRIPDAVIADYRLREEKTGAQAIRRIQLECAAPIPALIITGDTGPDRLREAMASGYQLLHKPVSPIQLRAFLAQCKGAHTPLKW